MNASRCGQYRNPVDIVGPAFIRSDGTGATFLDPLSPDMVELIRSSAHRLIVTVQFVADDERMTDADGVTL
jgi:hypothetical protein